MSLFGHENVTPGSDLQGKVTIKPDDDAAAAPTVSSPSVAEGDAGSTNLTFQVTLASPRPAMTFRYRTVPGTANSSDYVEVGGAPLEFPANTGTTPTTLPVTITVKGDRLDETDESLTLELLNATSGARIVAATGTIRNDDNNTELLIADSSVDETETGTSTLTFSMSLSVASGRPVSVSWETANGTALAGTDYNAASGSVAFAPGEMTKAIEVTVIGDTINEENETVLVNLDWAAERASSTCRRRARSSTRTRRRRSRSATRSPARAAARSSPSSSPAPRCAPSPSASARATALRGSRATMRPGAARSRSRPARSRRRSR